MLGRHQFGTLRLLVLMTLLALVLTPLSAFLRMGFSGLHPGRLGWLAAAPWLLIAAWLFALVVLLVFRGPVLWNEIGQLRQERRQRRQMLWEEIDRRRRIDGSESPDCTVAGAPATGPDSGGLQ